MAGGRKNYGKKKRTGVKQQGQADDPVEAGTTYGLTLIASESFYSAVAQEDCPAELVGNENTHATQVPCLRTYVVDKTAVSTFLAWLAPGITADPAAKVEFSSDLSKTDRAFVHRIVGHEFGNILETASGGVGDVRSIAVYCKGHAPKRELSAEEQDRANVLFRLTRDSGMRHLSRDEVAEMVMAGKLSEELQALWTYNEARVVATNKVMTALESGDAAAMQAAFDEHQDIIRHAMPDLRTGELPLCVAARMGNVEALLALLQAGAPVDAKDGNGKTALQVSRTFEQCDAEAVLLQHGAVDSQAKLFPLTMAAVELSESKASGGSGSAAAANGVHDMAGVAEKEQAASDAAARFEAARAAAVARDEAAMKEAAAAKAAAAAKEAMAKEAAAVIEAKEVAAAKGLAAAKEAEAGNEAEAAKEAAKAKQAAASEAAASEAAAKEAAAKEATAKEASKTTAAKETAAKEAAAKEAATKEAAAKETAAKEAAAKEAAVRDAAGKEAAANEAAVRDAVAKEAAAGEAATKGVSAAEDAAARQAGSAREAAENKASANDSSASLSANTSGLPSTSKNATAEEGAAAREAVWKLAAANEISLGQEAATVATAAAKCALEFQAVAEEGSAKHRTAWAAAAVACATKEAVARAAAGKQAVSRVQLESCEHASEQARKKRREEAARLKVQKEVATTKAAAAIALMAGATAGVNAHSTTANVVPDAAVAAEEKLAEADSSCRSALLAWLRRPTGLAVVLAGTVCVVLTTTLLVMAPRHAKVASRK